MGFKIRAAMLMPLLTVLAMWSQPGWADFLSGNKLLEFCESDTPAEFGQCLGYIASASDTHATWVDWGDMTRQMCIPPHATGGQLYQVVLKFLKEHPETLHLAAGSLVLIALGEAFPCPQPD